MALSELGSKGNEKPISPEHRKSLLVVATDVEGPHLLGDTALNTMSAFVRPPSNTRDIDYGAILYGETYNWFEDNFDKKGLGQEGSDILLAMVPLLYFGVTGEMIKKEAEKSKRTPGSEQYVKYLKSQGAVVMGVTTAWEDAHRDIVIDKVGLDGIVGTKFPIDDTRKQLIDSRQFEREMDITGEFLQGSFVLIQKISNSSGEQREENTFRLRHLIGQFYHDTLGISWDNKGKQEKKSSRSELARIMSRCDVIGDKRKAIVANQLFGSCGTRDSISLAIGDGFNDRRMLAESPWSIGINGADAAKAAKIGIVTSDLGDPLIKVTEIIRRNPFRSEENIQKIVREAQGELGDAAIIHRGGENMSHELVAAHKAMKKEIRGKGALLP